MREGSPKFWKLCESSVSTNPFHSEETELGFLCPEPAIRKFPPLLFGSGEARKRGELLAGEAPLGAGAAGPPHPHCAMASTARCPPRPPDPIERGKQGNPGALAGCACDCCPAEKEVTPCSKRSCPRPRRAHLPSRLAGTLVRPLGGPRPALRFAGCPPDVEPGALRARAAHQAFGPAQPTRPGGAPLPSPRASRGMRWARLTCLPR